MVEREAVVEVVGKVIEGEAAAAAMVVMSGVFEMVVGAVVVDAVVDIRVVDNVDVGRGVEVVVVVVVVIEEEEVAAEAVVKELAIAVFKVAPVVLAGMCAAVAREGSPAVVFPSSPLFVRGSGAVVTSGPVVGSLTLAGGEMSWVNVFCVETVFNCEVESMIVLLSLGLRSLRV